MKKLLAALTLMALGTAQADDMDNGKKGKWTFGVGMLAASLPHYAGSDQSKSIITPFPYIHYKSEKVTIDRSGIKGKLWQTDSVDLTLSGAGSIKVNSDDNRARAGMSDLGWVGSVGPAVNWYLQKDKNLFAQFAVRKAVAFDSDVEDIGWQSDLSLNWNSKPSSFGQGKLVWAVRGRLMFADSKYNNYFYGVGANDVTAFRSAYDSDGGYAGSELQAGVSYKSDRWWAGVFTRYRQLNGATFEDSPLVLDKSNVSAGIAFAWLFKGQ